MKKQFLLSLGVALMLGFSSCQKCAECNNCPLGISGDFCVDEFDSKADYDAAVANAEAAGCDCKEKLAGS